jgi:hypothetical protein
LQACPNNVAAHLQQVRTVLLAVLDTQLAEWLRNDRIELGVLSDENSGSFTDPSPLDAISQCIRALLLQPSPTRHWRAAFSLTARLQYVAVRLEHCTTADLSADLWPSELQTSYISQTSVCMLAGMLQSTILYV